MANPPQVFVGGDGAARKIISPDKLKQTRRFSLTSIIESLPKLCKDKDEFRQVDMDDTFSVSSQFSTENGLNSIHPALVEEEGEYLDVFYIYMLPAFQISKFFSSPHYCLCHVVFSHFTALVKEKKEKVPSPTGMMQSRTTTKRSRGVSRSPRVREHKTLSHKKL